MLSRRSWLLPVICLIALPASLAGQEPGSLRAYLDQNPLRRPNLELANSVLFVTRPFLNYVAEWGQTTRAQLQQQERSMLQRARFGDPMQAVDSAELALPRRVAGADTTSFLPTVPDTVPRRQNNPLGGVIGEHADLGIQVRGNGSLGGAWTRYRPCDPSIYFNCNSSAIPQLKPEVQFSILAGGTISQRVHVNVDYDQAREFDAANNLNVYYQGLADEVLQYVAVGDVTLSLPSSRYLTRGIPSGNFGFMATGQMGPIEFQTVFAQQKGDLTTREFKVGGGAREGMVQDATLVLDDAEYVRGQFFFLVPPADLFGQPHIDALALRATDAPAAVRPGIGGTIELYRDERPGLVSGGQNAQIGYFLADAIPPGGGLRHTGSFRRLLPEQDYIVHASGLWIMLRSPLRPDEALAVSFITETGDTVGRINAEAAPPGVRPQLRLLRSPIATHQPNSGTWDMEMHQVYRLDNSTEVDLSTVQLTISLGEESGGRTFRDVLGQQLSFLKFFGLDEDSPTDQLDAAQVFQPAREGLGGTNQIGGTYIILPTLRPFAAPAPVPSARLSAEDLRAALGRDANDAIYFDADPVSRAAAARFRLNFNYRVKVEGLVQSFSLGAFGIREGSERLTLGGRPLVRDAEYTIDYELGLVTLTDAVGLFATNPDAEIKAVWEQKPLFTIAPTSVFGASARYRVGSRGELNFVGLYQAEKTLMSRPQLGVEPGSAFLGGVSGRFDLGGNFLDRIFGTSLRGDRPSVVALTGEVAFSMPNPNRDGAAYLDDFEASDEVGLSVRRQDWKLGSRPASNEGDRGVLPFVTDAASAAPLVWQHEYANSDGKIGGALGPRTFIDRQINIIGNELPEPVMWLSFGRRTQDAPTPLPPPTDNRYWRSITTVLSTTGRDMSRSEFLEFYVSAGFSNPISLVFDIGTLSEDAFYVDSLGNTTGRYRDDSREWGIGVLDEEARLIDREVWGRDKDERGLWDQNCRTEPLATYALGDPRVNCTRNNGVQDSEDTNGNGILDDEDGQYFRYVIQLDKASEYLVRDTTATGTAFRLYRIPLRSGVSINGASDATWRFIRHLRMTVAGDPQGAQRVVNLARMRIVGSRWTKRDVHGVQRGLLDAEEAMSALADVRVGPVSRLTDGGRYSPPPGVGDELQDPTQQFGGGGHEINEKSLRLAYRGIEPGQRAEVYYRYPQQPRNLMTYSELRLWALPRAGNWGPNGDQELLVKIGTDPRNYYLYRSKLRPATGPRAVTPADWLPELVIDFRQWLELRADAERLLQERGPRPFGQDTLWSADSAYAIVLEDRARAPSLASVRELTFAVYNGGAMPVDSGEVWIDELRVLGPDRDPGAAGNISLDISAGDFMNASLSVANQGALFRQLNESPTFVGGADVNVSATAQLGKFLPASLGLDLLLSVTHSRNVQNPTFLNQSDVLADRLDGLRQADADATRIGLRISKRTPTANPLLSLLVDGTALRLSYNSAMNQSITARSEIGGFSSDVSFRRDIAPRSLSIVPGFLASALRALAPAALERSDAFQRLVGSQLRWSPSSLTLGSAYNDQLTRAYRYDRILVLPTDSGVTAIESPRQNMRNDAQLFLQPFNRLTTSIAVSSDRDVLATTRTSTRPEEQSAIGAARSSFGGFDVGWETARAITSLLNYSPQISDWLTFSYGYNNRYITDRNPSYLSLQVDGLDTTAVLQRRFESSRSTNRLVRFMPAGMTGGLGLDSASTSAALLRRFEQIDFNWRNTLSSQFERETFTPGVGYQLGLGSLDAFKAMGADTAARAQQRDEFAITSVFNLPTRARVDVGYRTSDIISFDSRGGTRTQNEVAWPRATLQWQNVRAPQKLRRAISSITALVGLERIERASDLGGNLNQRRGVTEVRLPLQLQVGFTRGFNASYRGVLSTGETLDPTGNAENAGNQHDFTLAGVIQPPQSWRQKLNGPLSIMLTYSEQQQQQCRYHPSLAELEGCIAFLDVGSRNGSLRIESKVSDVDVGVLLNYVSRQNHVGTRTGSSQFNLSFFGRFNFNAGQLPSQMIR